MGGTHLGPIFVSVEVQKSTHFRRLSGQHAVEESVTSHYAYAHSQVPLWAYNLLIEAFIKQVNRQPTESFDCSVVPKLKLPVFEFHFLTPGWNLNYLLCIILCKAPSQEDLVYYGI